MNHLLLTTFVFIISIGVLKSQTNADQQNNKNENTFIDKRDGIKYRIVKIGDQIMMAENLAYKPVKGKYLPPHINQNNVKKYGYLYNLETAKNVCPSGWHLPTKEEFEILLQYIGGNKSDSYNALIPSGNTGFAALFSGYVLGYGLFVDFDRGTGFWSSTQLKVKDGFVLGVGIHVETEAAIFGDEGECCFSVRCFKDQ